MAGPTRPTPPSAIDGYRRLERTRRVAAPASDVVVATASVAPAPRPRLRTARVAGALRLVGFVSVLAIIVGTSVSLASAGTRGGDRATPDEPSTPIAATAVEESPVVDEAPADDAAAEIEAQASAVDEAAAAAGDDTSSAVAGIADAPPAQTAAAPRSRALPFTGPLEVQRILLAGATLVLAGMLVQIAGQPLPARARRRR